MLASSKTRSQDSLHSSLQAAIGGAYEDIASSVHAGHQTQGSSATQSLAAPNSTFAQWRSLSRGRSASPGPRRPTSPLGVLVEQCCAQLAKRTAESVLSGIGKVADAVRVAHVEAATVAANAQSAIGTVQTLTTSFSTQMEVATTKIMGEMEEGMCQVASYSDAQTSWATTTLQKQLKAEIVSVASSTDETALKRTHDAEKRIRRDVEAELQKI